VSKLYLAFNESSSSESFNEFSSLGKRLKDLILSFIKALYGRISLGLIILDKEGWVFAFGLGDEFDSCSDIGFFTGNVFDKDSSSIRLI